MHRHVVSIFFFFNDTATTEIYTLSLHDALPICAQHLALLGTALELARDVDVLRGVEQLQDVGVRADRKSTRLNSSHGYISYAVFCLKKKKKHTSADIPCVRPGDLTRLNLYHGQC